MKKRTRNPCEATPARSPAAASHPLFPRAVHALSVLDDGAACGVRIQCGADSHAQQGHRNSAQNEDVGPGEVASQSERLLRGARGGGSERGRGGRRVHFHGVFLLTRGFGWEQGR